MREVYIVDAVRTPVGRMGGTLKNTQAHEMGGPPTSPGCAP